MRPDGRKPVIGEEDGRKPVIGEEDGRQPVVGGEDGREPVVGRTEGGRRARAEQWEETCCGPGSSLLLPSS
jgi:hypothetical protein